LKPSADTSSRHADTLPTDLNLLFYTYAFLLVTGVLHASVLGATIDPDAEFDAALRTRVFAQILVVEGIDTLVIAVALYLSWGRWRQPLPPQRRRIATWIGSLPLLAGLLALNFGYHALLREVLHLPLISDDLLSEFDSLAFLAICVQPAIVEEAYCRRFALDSLRVTTSTHTGVWVSATMFGFLHVAVLPSIPYLIMLGAVLAYLRIASGSLLLPIVMHLVHNTVVLLVECAGQ
jgi:membrane protease YdiL (CAAX protease family)